MFVLMFGVGGLGRAVPGLCPGPVQGSGQVVKIPRFLNVSEGLEDEDGSVHQNWVRQEGGSQKVAKLWEAGGARPVSSFHRFRGRPSTPSICLHLGHSWGDLEVVLVPPSASSSPENLVLKVGVKNRDGVDGGIDGGTDGEMMEGGMERRMERRWKAGWRDG